MELSKIIINFNDERKNKLDKMIKKFNEESEELLNKKIKDYILEREVRVSPLKRKISEISSSDKPKIELDQSLKINKPKINFDTLIPFYINYDSGKKRFGRGYQREVCEKFQELCINCMKLDDLGKIKNEVHDFLNKTSEDNIIKGKIILKSLFNKPSYYIRLPNILLGNFCKEYAKFIEYYEDY